MQIVKIHHQEQNDNLWIRITRLTNLLEDKITSKVYRNRNCEKKYIVRHWQKKVPRHKIRLVTWPTIEPRSTPTSLSWLIAIRVISALKKKLMIGHNLPSLYSGVRCRICSFALDFQSVRKVYAVGREFAWKLHFARWESS